MMGLNKFLYLKHLLVLILLTIIFDITGTYAQKAKLKFRSIKASDGLINNTALAIFEDSYGFIWLGTQHGLQRFDGKSFTNFTSEESDSTGLSHNFINDFCEDDNGDIWIATSIGLNRYSREQDRISRYLWKKEYNKKYDNIFVIRILHDKDQKDILWMITGESGLIKLNIETGESIAYTLPDNRRPQVLKPSFSKLYPNHLLIGTTDLFLFNKSDGRFKSIYSLDQAGEIPNNRINDLVFDPGNEDVIWCATGDLWGRGSWGGLLKYDLKTGESSLLTKINRPGEIPDIHILSLCFTETDKLWVGTRNNGVLFYDIANDRFYNYQYNEYDEGSIVTENAIRTMLLDRSGTIWFGTWGDGISVLSPALQKFTHYKHLPNIEGGLPDNWVTGITEDKDANIWIGTKAGGISKFDPVAKTFENHFREFTRPEDPVEVTYVFYDSQEHLWIGTYAHALYRYDPASGEKIHYLKGDTPRSVSQKRISAIAELSPGEILVSTYGGGLNIYTYKSDSFKQFLKDPDDSTSIPDNQIWIPFLGDDGNYYVGGNSVAGLIRFNPATQQFTEPLTRPNFNTFLFSVKDSKGRIFIDALSFGLSELHLKDTIYIHPLTDTKGHRIIGGESAAVDSKDNIWIGTTNGLIKYNPDTKELLRYNPDDGLQGYNFYRFAAFTSSTGAIYIGGLNGLNTFNPEEIKLSTYQPPVVLTGFKIFQENLKIGENSPLKKNILITEKIELSHYENDFSISFSGLDYSNPHKIQYKYRLVNHDDEWINAGNFSIAGYTNMDPGTYNFMVKSTNADGVWNDKITSLEIIIHPPWWRTTLAYFVYGLILIFLALLVDRLQRKRLKEKERARAREKELAQAREIEKAYTELKSTQNQLLHSEKMASLGELTAGIAHEIQNPLNFVNNFSEVNRELIAELKEELDKGDLDEVRAIADDIEKNENKINHHGKRADGIVKGMLLHSRSDSGKKEPSNINIIADEYLRLSYHGLRAKDKSFNAEFITDFDKTIPLINVNPQEIGRVLLNLINNAFYAVKEKQRENIDGFKPLVTVKTSQSDNFIVINVIDNGGGIPDKVKDKIFQPFFTTKAAGEGTGLGLSLSYDIITKGHGGKIWVETSIGEGTVFTIQLPEH